MKPRTNSLSSLAASLSVAALVAASSNLLCVNGAFANNGNSLLSRSVHRSAPPGKTFGMFDGEGGGGGGDDDSASTKAEESSGAVSPPKGGGGTWNPLRLAVLKLGMTELRFTSPLNYEKRAGSYDCASCGTVLFDSDGKYESGTGWPSWFRTAEGNVALKREFDGRVECLCSGCGGHLGHVFPDGPRRSDVSPDVLEGVPEQDLSVRGSSPSNGASRMPRYCMNGASLKFQPKE